MVLSLVIRKYYLFFNLLTFIDEPYGFDSNNYVLPEKAIPPLASEISFNRVCASSNLIPQRLFQRSSFVAYRKPPSTDHKPAR